MNHPAREMRAGRTHCWPTCNGTALSRYPSRPILTRMSTVVNQHETHTSPFKGATLPAADKTSGANSTVKGAQAFEQRVTQESGTH